MSTRMGKRTANLKFTLNKRAVEALQAGRSAVHRMG